MDKLIYPAVSIITVNYNGIRYLGDLFSSISNLDYPKDRIQVLMVDNCSLDSSVDFVKKNYPFVEIIKQAKNTGFAGGNNAGFKAATGDYIALINNDCSVDAGWLKALAGFAAGKDSVEKFGAAGSKVLFFYEYLVAEFSIAGGASINISGIEINPCISEGSGIDASDRTKQGFYQSDNALLKEDMLKSIKLLKNCQPAGITRSYTLSDKAIIGFPVACSGDKNAVNFKARINDKTTDASQDKTEIKICIIKNTSLGGGPAAIEKKQVYWGILNGESDNISIEIPDGHDFRHKIINSCGLEVNRSFYARDRGANTINKGQFESAGEVFSPSGSSLLISKKCLEDTGFFESGFFTYYEDVDLFWRARLRGWKMYYVPGSVANHYHCGTGTEWSKTFTYHVLRNRLLAIYRCGWPKLVLRSQAAFAVSLLLSAAGIIKGFLLGRKPHRPDVPIRLRIFFELSYLLPMHFFKRLKIRRTSRKNEQYIREQIIDF